MDLSDAFEYAAPVLRHPDGMKMHFLPVPPEVAEALREAGTRRVVGTLNGHPFRRALHGIGNGEYQFLIGKKALQEAGAAYGETVEVVVMPDPDPDHVEVPPELEAALSMDDEARARWEGFTPGRQRSMAIYVTQAKRPATREKRALELAHKMRTYTLYGDTPR
ncbi:MAG: YdeI/OmpD-associated family protein [Bacteroidota bacterium]